MRLILVAALLLAPVLSACSSTGASDQLDDFSSSMRGGFGHNTDTYGTQRRPDVYAGSTAPSLPSISSPGMGK
jgi:hypothetical protein